jgi:hypothetical protein
LLQFEGEKKLSKMRISKLFLKTFMLREGCVASSMNNLEREM